MIGLVIVTHGALASEFQAALEHIVGPQEAMATICIEAEDDMEVRRQDIVEAIGQVDGGNGVIILTDMFGGTPSNLSISTLEAGQVEVIAGLNLPMLVKLASIRNDTPIEQAVTAAQEAGKKYIRAASSILSG